MKSLIIFAAVIGLIGVIFMVDIIQGADPGYCNKELCKNGSDYLPNIACNNPGKLGSACKNATVVKIDANTKALLLDLHNTARNNVASGIFNGFPPAVNMSTMEWSDELAYSATLNAITCTYGHDLCRNSNAYPYAGQNIAQVGSSPNYKSDIEAINTNFNNWFVEYKNFNLNLIKSFGSSPKVIGHFTQIITARANRVGCALIRFPLNKFNYSYLVCNYGCTNILGKPIYVSGPVASKCKTGVNPLFKNLCNTAEIVNPNPAAVY